MLADNYSQDEIYCPHAFLSWPTIRQLKCTFKMKKAYWWWWYR